MNCNKVSKSDEVINSATSVSACPCGSGAAFTPPNKRSRRAPKASLLTTNQTTTVLTTTTRNTANPIQTPPVDVGVQILPSQPVVAGQPQDENMNPPQQISIQGNLSEAQLQQLLQASRMFHLRRCKRKTWLNSRSSNLVCSRNCF